MHSYCVLSSKIIFVIQCNVLVAKPVKPHNGNWSLFPVAHANAQPSCFTVVYSSGSQPFVVCGPFQKRSTLLAPCPSLGFCNVTAELFSKGLCSWPPENRSVAPVEKPWSIPPTPNHLTLRCSDFTSKCIEDFVVYLNLGRTQGVGLNTPLSLICYKTLLPAQRRLIVFAYSFFVNLST